MSATPRTDAVFKNTAKVGSRFNVNDWIDAERLSRQLETELIALQDLVDLQRDEFTRIKNIASQENNVFMKEIVGLCERSEQIITQNVSVIEQRDKLEKERDQLRATVDGLKEAVLSVVCSYTNKEIDAEIKNGNACRAGGEISWASLKILRNALQSLPPTNLVKPNETLN